MMPSTRATTATVRSLMAATPTAEPEEFSSGECARKKKTSSTYTASMGRVQISNLISESFRNRPLYDVLRNQNYVMNFLKCAEDVANSQVLFEWRAKMRITKDVRKVGR